MPAQKKIEKVADLSDKLNRAKSVVLTDYRGLTVSQLENLRKSVEAEKAEFEITKNTLLARSLGDKKVPAEALVGPTATLFAYEDAVAPLKALQEFIKTNNLPLVKVGFLGEKLLDALQVSELAKLPGREVLLAKLVGTLKGSQYGLVNVLSGNIRKLVYVLDAAAKSKSS
jgi:large subunit ribosomal protein L10